MRAQGLLSLSSRKVCNLKRALIDWDGQTGDEAERCTSGVATKREGSPLPIRAMQEADYPEAASKDLVDSFHKKPQQLDEARPEALSGSGGYRGSASNGFLDLIAIITLSVSTLYV